ncbi:hypothetical protein [Galbibacter orientalis]|uniref:Uncharacterized protein n=1 Tax=Galbibacter orientalis DSM 19592 TaxID=926559 RepID=I3C0V7_9FLAO|nr:hypothetical protein [Galbibacter orientalis]EIJ37250.1 hypothetical protein JoomaDRAFT_0190 [Galbibacter orientalis DSM 19592]
MMIFFTILFSLLIINVVLLLFSVNKLPKATTKTTAIYNQQYKDVTAKKEVANKEYDVVLKEAI